MNTKTLLKLCVVVLAVGLFIQWTSERQESRAVVGYDLGRQTVPTRTPIPEPTEPPPPTNTPAPPPPTNTPAPSAPEDQPESTDPTPTAEPPLVVANADANLYGGPGTDDDIRGVLRAGDAASVVGRTSDNSWWQVLYQGSRVWVAGDAVTANAAAYNVAIVDVSAGESPAILPTAGRGTWLMAGGLLLLTSGALLSMTGIQLHRRVR
jgi:uncharacterized protein YgiM (DUF1202 family)